jgi:hypothetical protein
MGSFERFKTKTHFNSLKRLVGVTALAALAVKLLTIALATAAGGGTPLDLLARVPASVADLGAALLVFEVLRPRRPLQLAARSAILVAVSPVLFVASGLHGDRVGVAVALLLLAIYLLIDSWVVLGWRTVVVEVAAAKAGAVSRAVAGAVDNHAHLGPPPATLPPGGVDAGPGHTGAPANGSTPADSSNPADGSTLADGSAPADGSTLANGSALADGSVRASGFAPGNGSAPADDRVPAERGTRPSRGSVSLPK